MGVSASAQRQAAVCGLTWRGIIENAHVPGLNRKPMTSIKQTDATRLRPRLGLVGTATSDQQRVLQALTACFDVQHFEPSMAVDGLLYCTATANPVNNVPSVECEALNNAEQAEAYLLQVTAQARWQQLCERGLTRGGLSAFHAPFKYLLMAHDPARYRSLGRLLGQLPSSDLRPTAEHYLIELMAALRTPATRANHGNTLLHIAGYLKRDLTPPDKQALVAVIDAYRLGQRSLNEVRACLRQHFDQHPHPYIAQQLYLYPPIPDTWTCPN